MSSLAFISCVEMFEEMVRAQRGYTFTTLPLSETPSVSITAIRIYILSFMFFGYSIARYSSREFDGGMYIHLDCEPTFAYYISA